ncbi:hypothetical protein EJ08DRAFT_551614, partial [Tothia fuscella]
EQSINMPQLAVLLILGFLVFRWYWSSSSASSSSSSTTAATPTNAQPRINPAHVEQLVQMFPQVDRRSIMWELQRNGGNVQAATETVLSGRGLQTPPASFQPAMPATPSATRASGSRPKSTHPDLITRYNLSSRLGQTSDIPSSTEQAPESESGKKQKQAWSANKNERQALLQKRREEMILAARRKME